LQTWKDIEIQFGDVDRIKEIMQKQPVKVKKQRQLAADENDEEQYGISHLTIISSRR